MENDEIAIPVDTGYLSGLLQQAWGNPTLQVHEYRVQGLTGGLEVGSAIFRLHGSAVADDQAQSWSLILKIIQPDVRFDDPQGYRYWKRDALACQSGILQKLPGQVSAPRCYDVCEKSDGSVWMWLEEVRDELEHLWSVE